MEKVRQIAINEKQRLKALYSYNILDNRSDKFLDSITELASKVCDTPIALISLIDEKRQWFLSKVGIKTKQTLREISICQHTILQKNLFVVSDALNHPLFKDNPLVTGDLKLRFYAGMPLTNPAGLNLGTLCVVDHEPKILTSLQKSALTILSKSIINYLALRKSKIDLSIAAEDLHNLFLNSPDLLCTATPDGYFKKISSAFRTELGYSENELLNQPFINLVHPDDQQETIQVLSKLNKKGANVRFFRNRYRCKNGSYLWLSWNASFQQNSGQIIATARNITEKIQMEEEIKRLVDDEKKFNEDKILQLSVLTSAVSHEMLNPLNMVLGFSGVSLELVDEILARNDTEIAINNLKQIRTDLLKIEEHAHHMESVVGTMSSINWNSNQYSEENKKTGKSFRINRVISECTKLAYSGFKNNHPDFDCEFDYNFDKSEPRGVLSVNDFSKSIMNLIYNAFEAIIIKESNMSDFVPKVKIQTTLFENNISITIANNGIGIPTENWNKVFNPFFTTKPSGKGLGLGLSISYNIIKIHHGSILIEKSDDEETVFKILLPAGN